LYLIQVLRLQQRVTPCLVANVNALLEAPAIPCLHELVLIAAEALNVIRTVGAVPAIPSQIKAG
jgi:hypothetical protein